MARLVPVLSRARVDLDGLERDKSFVERSKESLDPVVPNLVVADVIQIFRAIKVLWSMDHVRDEVFISHVTQGRPMLYPWPCMIIVIVQG